MHQLRHLLRTSGADQVVDVVAHDAQAEQVEAELLLRPRKAEQNDLAGLRPAQVEGLVVAAHGHVIAGRGLERTAGAGHGIVFLLRAGQRRGARRHPPRRECRRNGRPLWRHKTEKRKRRRSTAHAGGANMTRRDCARLRRTTPTAGFSLYCLAADSSQTPAHPRTEKVPETLRLFNPNQFVRGSVGKRRDAFRDRKSVSVQSPWFGRRR